MVKPIIKTVSFSILIILLSLVPMMDVLYSSRLHPLFIENSLTQKMQLAVLAMVALLYASRSLPDHQDRVLMMQMMLFFSAMAVRESDSNLDYWLFDGAWQTIVGLLVLPAVILTARHWHALIQSLARWSRTRSCGLMIAGLVTVLLFSRLLGMESMWQNLMNDHYIRSVKNLAEEGTELIGYSLILIAALDQAQNRSI